MRIQHDTYTQVFGTVYVALMTNMLLALSTLPFAVVVIATEPAQSWALLALLAPLCAPAFAGVCAVFAAFSADGTTTVVRTFARGWRRFLRRSLAIGTSSTAALVVLAVDVRAFWGAEIGAVLIPVFVTLGVLVLMTATLGLVGIVERPDARLRDVLRAAVYLGLRRWYLSAGSLFVLALLMTMVAARPALALGLAAAPLLYVVWANSRFALRPVLAPSAVTPQPA